MKAFVVCAESGEYTDTLFGLAGVFKDRPSAEAHAARLREGRAAFDAWHKVYCAALNRIAPGVMNFSEEQSRTAKDMVGPSPGYVQGERYGIIEFEVDAPSEWQSPDLD